MRSSTLFAALFSLSAVVAAAQIACGGDDNGAQNNNPNPTPQYDSGPTTFVFPDASAGTTVAIDGAGSVGGSLRTGEAGPPPVTCTSDGTTTTGQCHAAYQDTLYALPANGWQFDHWDLGDDAAQPITAPTYYVGQYAPAVVTAVFLKDPFGTPDSALPPPHDSGPQADTNAPDSADANAPDTSGD